MNNPGLPYHIFPLGNTALTIDFGNIISDRLNREVMARFQQFKKEPLPGTVELVPAYSSLTIYYDLLVAGKSTPQGHSIYEWVKKLTEEKLLQPVPAIIQNEKLIKIPVCYEEEYALDIKHLATEKNISVDEVISLHTAKDYKVFMMGFLPGFAYMGEVNEKIAAPRKTQPVTIAAGSVGIAGKQTGIYPFSSPGGWQIIGRTPLHLFDAALEPPVLLQAGDKVQFYKISKKEFIEMQYSSLTDSSEDHVI